MRHYKTDLKMARASTASKALVPQGLGLRPEGNFVSHPYIEWQSIIWALQLWHHLYSKLRLQLHPFMNVLCLYKSMPTGNPLIMQPLFIYCVAFN